MNIQIITHSQTGNSLQVANTIKTNFEQLGHTVALAHIQSSDERSMDPNNIKINKVPVIKEADLLIFGGPVRGFAASPGIMKAITSVEGLKGKRCVLYTTEFFPLNVMGGNQAMRMMTREIEARGGKVVHAAKIHWYNWGREIKIIKLVRDIKALL